MKTVVLFLFSAAAVLGQAVPGRYVVELAGDPAAIAAARQGSRFAAREADFAARRAAVRQSQTDARTRITELGGTVLESMDTVANALMVSIPDARAAELSKVPGVVKVHAVHRVRPLLNHALPIHKVPDAWSTLPLGQNSAGAGIKIGMIDSGINVSNPAFSDPLPPVAGFPQVLANSDLEFTNAKIIVAKNYTHLLPDGGDPDANDRDGHGTGTAMAAAGGTTTSPYGVITGVAPKAYLGSYKVLDANGATSDVIAKAIDDAVADGMDVLNISLGSWVASYSDIDPNNIDLAAIEAATKAGVVVAVAAGNSGPGASSISDYGSLPDVITLGAIMNDRALGYAITVSGVAPYEAYPGDGPDPGQAITGPLFNAATVDPTGLACSPLKSGTVAGMVVLVLRGTCTFESKMDNVAAGGALAAIIYNSPTGAPFGTFTPTVGAATLPVLFVNQADGADLIARAAASPGLQATLDFLGATAFPARTDLTDFSSRGPNIGSAMKPDIVAVGEEIVTATQDSFSSGESYNPSGFIDTGGTSFSTPLTAGAAAVLKAARPGLTMQQYRSLLINSAGPATSGPGVPATVQQAGTGVLNVAAALSGTVAAYPTALNFGTGAGAISSTLNLTLSNVGTVSDTYTIGVAPVGNSPAPALSTNTVQLDPNGSQQISATVNASGLAPGEYQGYLQVAGANTSNIATIPYWFAVPGSAPAGITILYSDYYDPARTVSYAAVIFRIVDIAGLPYTGQLTPQIVISAGGGSIRNFYAAGDIPGTYALDIRTGTSTMELDISIAGMTQAVIIPIL
ncbi:MAG: S8 family serine peptidase [Bryobacteraceae bacterium]|jgi:subtilisin family serine protease